MKLRNSYITYKVDQNVIMVGTGNTAFKGIMKANPVAAFILECLQEEISEEELINKMLEKYDADRETITNDVHSILDSLRSVDALQES